MKAPLCRLFYSPNCKTLTALICLLFFVLINYAYAQTGSPRYLELSEGNVPEIRDELKYYQEADKVLSPEDLLNHFNKGLFESFEGSIFNLPYTMNNHWLGVEVKNISTKPATFYFKIANPHLHHLELFRSDNGKLVSLGVSGDKYPFNERKIKNRNFVYQLALSAQEETILLLKINTGGRPITIPIDFLSSQEYDEEKMGSYLFWGIVSGFILLTATLSFILFFLLRDRLYLIYSLSNILLLTWIVGRNGLGYQYIWPDYPEVMARIIFISAELNMVVYLYFMQLFVGQNKENSLFFTSTRWVMGILLFLVSLIFLPYPKEHLEVLLFYQALTDLINLIALFLLFAGIVEKVRQKNRLAKLLLFSTLFSFSGVVMLLLVRMDFLEANTITLNAVYVGFMLEMILLAVGLALRYRKQLEERDNLQKELQFSEIDKAARIALATENERIRIAADMHDDLGASLSGLQLMSELSGRKENMAEVKNDIYKIHQSAKELSMKMRDIVWTLNPKNDTLENLLLYIHKYGQQLFEESGISYKGILPGNLPDILVDGSARRQLLLLVKEAFNNVIKHAKASEVFCSFDFSENFMIHIRDNGQGIQLPPGQGNGIHNMQNRIQKLDGELRISTEKGTSITFILPISKLTTHIGVLNGSIH